MALTRIFEYVTTIGILGGAAIGIYGGSGLFSIPPQRQLFQDHVYKQAIQDFPAVPADGAHMVRIDFGQATRDSREAQWNHIKLHGGMLAGGAAVALASGVILLRHRY